MAKKKKQTKNTTLKKFVFIPVVILIVVAISYLGKYIYNRYLEFEKNNKVELNQENNVNEDNSQVEIYIYE